MDSAFCVLEAFISIVDKGVLGLALNKKRYYWRKGVPKEEILRHIQNKEVGGVKAVQGSIGVKSYHIMAKKDPNYVMLMMTIYGTLVHFKGSDTQQRYKGADGELVTKRFNYCEVFRNHFNYRQQVYNSKYWRYSHISI